MKVLITGGCGFIGSNFIRHMLNYDEKLQIINVDKLSYGSNLNNLKNVDKKRYRFIKGDITNLALMKRLIKNVEAVINFAAETHVDRSIANPWPFFESNAKGVLTILEAIRQSNKAVKFIQIGTDESYGSINVGSFKENDVLNPSSPYSASKAAADLFCIAYNKTYDLNIIITRCTNNFGPYQFPEKLIPKTIIRAKLDLKIPIYGSGKNVRDWIYVLDHCEALRIVLEKGKPGEIYNIAGGNEWENLKLIKKILELMGKSENLIEFIEDRPGHDFRYSLNFSKIKEKLNWMPKYSFEEALKQTINWYLENEWWWKPLVNENVLHPTPWKLKWNKA